MSRSERLQNGRYQVSTKPKARAAALVGAGAVSLALLLGASPASAQVPPPADALGEFVPVNLPDITVDSATGTLSADGRIDSVKAFVEKICAETNIKLLAYGAADRASRVRFKSVPIQEALERLLWSEDYLLGASNDDPTRLTWLQILGTEGGDLATAPASSASASQGQPIVLPRTGYTTRSTTIRKRTAEAFAKRLDDDAEARKRFLATPDKEYADSLSKESYAVAFLMDLSGATKDRAAKMKVDRLRRTLQSRPRPW
jgi:hypothetical protein